jgi:pimeloyl-ACP methyl ester carboxylesterase
LSDEARDTPDDSIRWLQHSQSRLALHRLRDAEGPSLLLLHGLGQSALTPHQGVATGWPGPIYALDFTGHGRSTLPAGGGYTCEMLMGDVDAALAEIGPATICGRGLGAYVALLIAGARPVLVRGAILCDGPGLTGGGPRPTGPVVPFPDPVAVAPPDPFALVELARDLRPPDYATEFARQALEYSNLEPALVVCAAEDPEWLNAVIEQPGIERMKLAAALAHYAHDTHFAERAPSA